MAGGSQVVLGSTSTCSKGEGDIGYNTYRVMLDLG